jgi:hypothetical protein
VIQANYFTKLFAEKLGKRVKHFSKAFLKALEQLNIGLTTIYRKIEEYGLHGHFPE